MTAFAPYRSVMRLGQGFNSFTQEICIDDAVTIHQEALPISTIPRDREFLPDPELFRHDRRSGESFGYSERLSERPLRFSSEASTFVMPISQNVTYIARAIDSFADIVDVLNMSSSATINYGAAKFLSGTSMIKESTISEGDIGFIVSVKVTNETSVSAGRMEFNPMRGLDPSDFTTVYGDCFIAGFLEGGEFSAIISVAVYDKSKISKVKFAIEAQLSFGGMARPLSGHAMLDEDSEDIWKDTEISISVNWVGGGEIKEPTMPWDLATVVATANSFPSQVARFSQKTSAILMRYTSLRSFHEANANAERPYVVLDYRICDLYTAELLNAFVAYKALWKRLSKMLKEREQCEAKEPSDEVPNPIPCDPIALDSARLECRKAMTVILEETKLLAKGPEIAKIDDNGDVRRLPCPFPAELEMRLPICKPGSGDSCKSNTPSEIITGAGLIRTPTGPLSSPVRILQQRSSVAKNLSSLDNDQLRNRILALQAAPGRRKGRSNHSQHDLATHSSGQNPPFKCLRRIYCMWLLGSWLSCKQKKNGQAQTSVSPTAVPASPVTTATTVTTFDTTISHRSLTTGPVLATPFCVG